MCVSVHGMGPVLATSLYPDIPLLYIAVRGIQSQRMFALACCVSHDPTRRQTTLLPRKGRSDGVTNGSS